MKSEETQTVSFAFYPIYYEAVWIHVAFSFLRFPFLFYFILFFSRIFPHKLLLFIIVHEQQPQLLTKPSKNRASVHCSQAHKFHFSAIFSLKMGPTVLFTYLKIILLQCFQFSVFNFSKTSSIQTDHIYIALEIDIG